MTFIVKDRDTERKWHAAKGPRELPPPDELLYLDTYRARQTEGLYAIMKQTNKLVTCLSSSSTQCVLCLVIPLV